jgi:hypothetical protein
MKRSQTSKHSTPGKTKHVKFLEKPTPDYEKSGAETQGEEIEAPEAQTKQLTALLNSLNTQIQEELGKVAGDYTAMKLRPITSGPQATGLGKKRSACKSEGPKILGKNKSMSHVQKEKSSVQRGNMPEKKEINLRDGGSLEKNQERNPKNFLKVEDFDGFSTLPSKSSAKSAGNISDGKSAIEIISMSSGVPDLYGKLFFLFWVRK